MSIHPTAIVHDLAQVDETAEIGPYAVIEQAVRIGPDVRVYPHAFITGWTQVGAGCEIHPGATIGHAPQDLSYTGVETYCRIGERTVIREGASIHRGTVPGSATVVGKRCFIMAGAHVAHNCVLGDEVKLANVVQLGGHVQIGDGAFIGGGTSIHQFVRVGTLVMVSGGAALKMDVPPYFTANIDGRCAAVNVVGMRRAGFTPQQRSDVQLAYRILYRSRRPFRDAVNALADAVTTDVGHHIVDFVRQPSRRGITSGVRPRNACRPRGEEIEKMPPVPHST